MEIDPTRLPAGSWPRHASAVGGRELCSISIKALPGPAFGRIRIRDAQPTIAAQAAGEEKASLPGCLPAFPGGVPTVPQDMSQGASDWFKMADASFPPVHLTLEGHLFLLAGRWRPIQM